MQKFLFSVALFFSIVATSSAQKHDYQWLFGGDVNVGLILLDFNFDPPSVFLIENPPLEFDLTNASISDSAGNLLFYTNGIVVANAQHQIMENGDSLNPGPIAWAWHEQGNIVQQGALFLPLPNNERYYYLFHTKRDNADALFPGPHISTLYYSLIDTWGDQGLGSVIEKNVVLVLDTLGKGNINTAKHANGRDWWILVPEYDKYSYHQLLLDLEGIHYKGIISVPPVEGYGQPASGFATFSPDGTKYARHDLRGFPAGHFVRLYDFDRCTGELSKQVHLPLSDTAGVGGLAFSPDSRYLYVTSQELVYQFDLVAPDVEATKTIVAVTDGYRDTLPNGIPWFFPSTFSGATLGPDGRVYIHAAGSARHLHVIQYPNKGGEACEVRQHSIKFPASSYRTIPNVPHYRLGPLDGSPCDTLGLDNHPLAGFRYEVDTMNPLRVTFTDNSFYEPTAWLWDFGDASTSTLKDPLHKYTATGTYTVCLTVSNEYDSDTACREVTVEAPNATRQAVSEVVARLYPNPARSAAALELPQPLRRPALLALYNPVGREVFRMKANAGDRTLFFDVSGLPGGVYFWELSEENQLLQTGKIVVIR